MEERLTHPTNSKQGPGLFVCYANATWNAGPGAAACQCSTWYGASGLDCTQADTPTARWWIASGVLFCAAFATMAVVAATQLLRLKRAAALGLDATSTALVQLLAGSVFITVAEALSAAQAALPALQTDVNPKTKDKQSELYTAYYGVVVVGVILILLAVLTVPLLWIEIAQRTRKMRKEARQGVSQPARVAIGCLEVALAVALLALMLSGNSAYFPIATNIIAALIAVLYVAGIVTMRNLLRQAISQAKNLNVGETTLYESALTRMQRTAIVILGALLVIIGVGIAEALLSQPSWKDYAPAGPFVPAVLVLYQFAWSFPLAVMDGTILHYVSASVTAKLNKSATGSASPHLAGGGGGGGGGNASGTPPPLAGGSTAGGGGGGGDRTPSMRVYSSSANSATTRSTRGIVVSPVASAHHASPSAPHVMEVAAASP